MKYYVDTHIYIYIHMLYMLYMNMLVYATAARSGLSEIAVFFTSTSFTRNHVCLHTRLLHMISRSFGCGGGRSGNVSVHLLTSLMLYAPHVFLTWSHISGSLRSGTMSTSGNGDTIIAIPCGKWFQEFSKHFANETLRLQVTQVKRAESATGGGTFSCL